MLAFLNANKTKITGALLTTLAFVQTNAALGTLLSPTAYAWTMFFVGLFVTFLGFLNTPTPPAPPTSKESGFARPLMLAFLLAVAVPVTIMLPGCGINRPLEEAQTLEQKAFATYASFVIVKEQAAKLYVDPSTPEEVKKALKTANDAATAPINLMYEGAMALKDARADLDAGRTTEEKVLIAAQELLNWYLAARPLYESFDSEVQKVRN
jgi:hypothetical protein